MKVTADQNELDRLAALHQYQIVETPPEETFDAIARLAAQICQTPVALINFIDDRLQWFKSHIGLEIIQMPPKIGLCSRCIQQRDVLVIPDTLADEQSRSNPVVNNYPYIRFYAGVPLIVPGEYAIGALCVIDYQPRELNSEQLEALRLLSHQVVNQLEIRRKILAEKAYFQTNSHLQINTHSQILTPVATQVEEIAISSMRSSEHIKAEIQQTLGFFPPFFSSALGNPHVFENLWQQTLSAYLNNPLSPIFKEKLSAYLSRYCSVPYCMIVHSSSLRPLGVEAREILALLQASPPQETEINKHLQVLQAQPELQTNLPAENSAVEESLLYCAIYIAIAKEEAEFYKFELRRLLGNINYQHLITFIAYVRTCHEWMEAYPEVMYEEDQRAINYLAPLIAEEPGLAEFFRNYVEQVKEERQTWTTRLAQLEERKRNEQALRQSEERYRTLVEQASDGIFLTDADGKYLAVNSRACKMLGYEAAELLQMSGSDLVADQYVPLIPQSLKSLKAGNTHTKEWLLKRKDGTLIPVEISSKMLPDGTLQGIARDITERKRSQALVNGQKRILEMIATGASLFEILNSLVKTIEEQSSGMIASILLVDASGTKLQHCAAPSLDNSYIEAVSEVSVAPNQSCCGRAAYLGKPVLVEDIANDPFCVDFKDLALNHGLKACCSTPIFSSNGKVLGTFAMYYRQHQSPSLYELQLIEIATHIAGIAIERQQNEQALRLNEEKFRSLVEQTNDWVWEIDANGVFTYLSPQVQKIVGYEPAELIGKTTFDLMSVSESERFLLVIGEFLSLQAPFINLEKTLMHKNGNLVVLETSGAPVFDAQGVLLGYRGIARDVTERKQSEQALRRTEERIRIINEAIPQQVWTARPNGLLDYVNKRVLDYFERTFEEMIDAGWQSVIHPDDLPGCLEIWGESLTSGEPYEIEFRLFKASVGSYRWYLGRAVPIYDEDGRIVSWFGTNTDIHDRKLAEEERDRFFSLSLDNLAIANFDGYFTRLNPAWEETTGYTTEELLTQPYLNFVHPEDINVTNAESEKLANGNLTQYFENRYRCKDGSLKWLAWKSVAVVEVGLVYAIARDITPKKLAEQERIELLQREQTARAEAEATRNRINNILESITDAFFAVNEQWKFTYVNHQAEVLLQRKREELIDESIWDEFPHAVGSMFEDNYRQVVSERVSVTFEEFYPPLNTWFEVYAYPSKDGMSVYFKDITERKQAQAELQLQNRRAQLFSEISLKIRQSLQLEEILESTVTEVKRILQADRVLVYRILPDGTGSAIAESVNPQWSSILEKTFPSEVFPEEYRLLYSQGRIRGISDVTNGELAPCLTDFVQNFNVKAKLVVPIILNGQLWGLLIAHQCEHTRQWSTFETELLEQLANQISIALAQSQLLEQETRQRLELMRSNEELQQFAYIASHDLQEPLRKIQAFGDRLKLKHSNVLNEQGIDYLERMQSAAQRMQVLINDLLSLSRVTTKSQRFVTVDLNKVVQEVLSDLEIRIQQTKGRVEVDHLPTIDADPLQMRQLIQNLISNALKFHPKEEVSVIKIYSRSINNHIQPPSNFSPVSDTYEIVVEDNGIGFDEKYLDRIFNVFQRLHSRSEYEGTGMGLAICRKIVEQHNGSITAKSQLGHGAKFIVTLPTIANKGEKHIEGAATSHYINGR